MNPAALKANIGVLPTGATLIVNSDAFDERNLRQGGIRRQPAHRRVAGGVHRLRGADDLHHPGGVQGGRRQAPRRRAVEELLRPGPRQLALHPPDRAHARVDHRSGSRTVPRSPRPTPGPSGPGYNFGETAELFESELRGPPGHLRAGRVHPDHRQPGAGLGADRRRPAGRAAAVPRAATRSPRRRTSSTSCPGTRTSASAPSRPRTRSPASAPPSAPPSAARSASRRPAARASTSSPRPSAGRQPRAPAASIVDIQRGGPSTGLPTKTEQADLLHAMYGRHGEAPAADRRRPDAVALLRRRHRGGPHRGQVPHPGDPALRRLPGQRRRAVAAARPRRRCPTSTRRSPPSPTTPTRTARRRSGPTARPGDPGPPLGAPGHARARAPHRGPGEGGRPGQRLLRPGQPRADGPAAGGQGRRHRRGHPRRRGRRRRRDAEVLVLGWGSTYGAIAARRSAGSGPGA